MRRSYQNGSTRRYETEMYLISVSSPVCQFLRSDRYADERAEKISRSVVNQIVEQNFLLTFAPRILALTTWNSKDNIGLCIEKLRDRIVVDGFDHADPHGECQCCKSIVQITTAGIRVYTENITSCSPNCRACPSSTKSSSNSSTRSFRTLLNRPAISTVLRGRADACKTCRTA